MQTSNKKQNKPLSRISPWLPLLVFVLFTGAVLNTGCGFVTYGFKDVSIPDSIKTVKVNALSNKARYINPQLAPQLSDKLRQKIVNQTKLSPTNNDADWELSGDIVDYSISTSGIAGQQVSTSRLNVALSITLYDRKTSIEAERTRTFNVNRSFDYAANLTLQAAESQLLDEMLRNLTDEIFNQVFSRW